MMAATAGPAPLCGSAGHPLCSAAFSSVNYPMSKDLRIVKVFHPRDRPLMLPNLTPAVARALQTAQDWARRLRATEVQPLHFLFGLLDEEEGKAALLLERFGVSAA